MLSDERQRVKEAIADAIEESSVDFDVRIVDAGIRLTDGEGSEWLLHNPVSLTDPEEDEEE
jgi:hypothetical protein